MTEERANELREGLKKAIRGLWHKSYCDIYNWSYCTCDYYTILQKIEEVLKKHG